jgi:prepilin signal peptidase PulO-like enzyme (type II secretory pathway)
VVLPDILLQLSFRRFKLESRKAGHFLLLRCSIHKEYMYKQDHCIPYLFHFVCLYSYEFWLSLCKIVRSSVILLLPLINYSTLYSTAITWLQVYARPSIQLHHETTMHVSCSKQSKHHALHFLFSVRETRVMSLLLYHLGM